MTRWKAALPFGDYEDRLDRSSLRGDVPVADLDYDDLRAFADDGNRFSIEITEGDWTALISGDGPTPFVVDANGEWSDAFADSASIDRAADAAVHDPRQFLLECGHLNIADTRVTLLNKDPDFHWIRVANALSEHGRRDTWYGLALLIFRSADRQRLIVQDSSSDSIECGNITIHGPDVFPDMKVVAPPTPVEYAAAWFDDSRRNMPPPTWFGTLNQEGLEDTGRVMNGIAEGLCWLWLATGLDGDPSSSDDVRIEFDVPTTSSVVIRAEPRDGRPVDTLNLWEWVTSSPDPLRREAFQQAVGLSVHAPDELTKRVSQIESAARYLLKVAQGTLVAEVLSSRRAAREAALAMARSVANDARTIGRATFDRAIVQVAAAIGILLANKGNLVNQNVATWLFGAVFALLIATALTAFCFEFRGADAAISTFDLDLESWHEVLSNDDIEEIKGLSSVKDARVQLRRARCAAALLLIAAAIGVGALVWAVRQETSSVGRPKSATPTTSSNPPRPASRSVKP
jgi:hypothetical protein